MVKDRNGWQLPKRRSPTPNIPARRRHPVAADPDPAVSETAKVMRWPLNCSAGRRRLATFPGSPPFFWCASSARWWYHDHVLGSVVIGVIRPTSDLTRRYGSPGDHICSENLGHRPRQGARLAAGAEDQFAPTLSTAGPRVSQSGSSTGSGIASRSIRV